MVLELTGERREAFFGILTRSARQLEGRVGQQPRWKAGGARVDGVQQGHRGVEPCAERLFLGARADWPAHEEFVADGRKGLYHAILKHGGTRAWAARMGVQWVDHAHRRVRAWTDEGVREELARFLADRDHWPTEREFRAAGLGGLSRALQRLGGTERWQREFSLRRPGS